MFTPNRQAARGLAKMACVLDFVGGRKLWRIGYNLSELRPRRARTVEMPDRRGNAAPNLDPDFGPRVKAPRQAAHIKSGKAGRRS